MAILLPSDIPDIDPTIAPGLIASAQAIAEGQLGANRPLELSNFTEILNIPAAGTIQLSRMPLVSVVEAFVRGYGWWRFGRDCAATSIWQQLDSSDWLVDTDNGEFQVFKYGVYNATSPTLNFYWRYRRPEQPRDRIQLRITYQTGFDFTQSTPETQAIKAAIAGIVRLRQSGLFQGMKLFDLANNYRVMYDGPSGATANGASLMDEYLSIVKKYQPRMGAI